MRILFLGGTGNISTACVERALALGYKVTVLNRGNHPLAFSQPVAQLVGDRHDPQVLAAAAAQHYDVVANFLGYTPDEVALDFAAFAGQVGQYVYISSAAAYSRPLPPKKSKTWAKARTRATGMVLRTCSAVSGSSLTMPR